MRERGRYHTLDAMRGVAALLVAIYHVQRRWPGSPMAGYLAVDLFFVLSGFVIALNYTDRFAAKLTVARFCELRLIRLFPLYALGLALGLAKLATGHILHIPSTASPGNVACAVLFGAFVLPDPCSAQFLFPLNGPAWSLFFEIAINFAFALFLWRAPLALLAGLMALSALSFFAVIAPPYYFDVGWMWGSVAGGVARTIFSFCAGILLFRTLPFRWRRKDSVALLPVLAMTAVIGFAVPEMVRVPFEIFAVVGVFPGLVFLGCLLESPSSGVRRVFGFLGDLSYPIYAIHWPLIAIVMPIMAWLHESMAMSAVLFLIVLLPTATVAAWGDRIVRGRISASLKLWRMAAPSVV